jgi:hypothetical protein
MQWRKVFDDLKDYNVKTVTNKQELLKIINEIKPFEKEDAVKNPSDK